LSRNWSALIVPARRSQRRRCRRQTFLRRRIASFPIIQTCFAAQKGRDKRRRNSVANRPYTQKALHQVPHLTLSLLVFVGNCISADNYGI